MNKPILMMLAYLLSALISFPVSAQAQAPGIKSPLLKETAPPAPIQAQPPAIKSLPLREVTPRDLMTVNERLDLWHKMSSAQTPVERLKLWEHKYAELQKRATEMGMVLRSHGPIMISNGFHDFPYRWGFSHHMGLRGTGYCGMFWHPPLMR